MNALDDKQVAAWKSMMESAQRLMWNKEFAEAESILLDAYERGREIFGPDDGNVGLVLLRLVEVCDEQGKKELALQFKVEIERILALYRADFGNC